MDLIDQILTECNDLHFYIKNEEYTELYVQYLMNTKTFSDKLEDKTQAKLFSDLYNETLKLIYRAEAEGFKLGLRSGIEIKKNSQSNSLL